MNEDQGVSAQEVTSNEHQKDDGRGTSYYENIKMENSKFEEYLRQMLPEEQVSSVWRRPRSAATFRLLRKDSEFERQMDALRAMGVVVSRSASAQTSATVLGRREVRKNRALFIPMLVRRCLLAQTVRAGGCEHDSPCRCFRCRRPLSRTCALCPEARFLLVEHVEAANGNENFDS
jgi:hypothetical protein